MMRLWPHALWLCGMLGMQAAGAHDLWLERDDDGYLLFHGHRHSGHAGEEVIPYPPEFARQGTCLEPDGRVTAIAPDGHAPARYTGRCAALLVEASSGVWTTTVQGTRNQPPETLTGVIRSWRSLGSVKRLDAWSPALAQPLGDGLELVPLHDPFTLRPRDKLRLRVTLAGQPHAGVTVAYGGEARGVSDAAGLVNLRIRTAGTQLITASIRLSTAEDGVGEVVHETALQFEWSPPR